MYNWQDEPYVSMTEKQFIAWLAKKKLSYNTANQYLLRWRISTNKEHTLKLNPYAFHHRTQLRLPLEMQQMEKFKSYFLDNNTPSINLTNRYKLAIAFDFYTALRVSELLRITKPIIDQLLARQPVILLKQKQSNTWTPMYTDKFIAFLQFFITTPTYLTAHDRVFDFSRFTLLYYMKLYFRSINKTEPPTGFGPHSIRNYWSTVLASENVGIAQTLLGHARPSTTERYRKNALDGKKIDQFIESNPLYAAFLR